jgi:hypothetical protein
VERAATTIGRMAQAWLGFIFSLGNALVKSSYPSSLARVYCSIVDGTLVEARHPSALARVCCIYVAGFFVVKFALVDRACSWLFCLGKDILYK